jgi:hypothetical protein
MNTKTFATNIPQQMLDRASNTNKIEYPEEIRSEIEKAKKEKRTEIVVVSVAGIIGGIISFVIARIFMGTWWGNLIMVAGPLISVFATGNLAVQLIKANKKLPQDNPIDAMENYLKELLHGGPYYERFFDLIFPPALENLTTTTISDASKKLKENIIAEVSFREMATCQNCEKQVSGLWSERTYLIPRKQEKDGSLYRCNNCEGVWCSECYFDIKLNSGENHRNCPQCGEKIEGSMLIVFEPNPIVTIDKIKDLEVETSALGDNLVDVQASVTLSTEIKDYVGENSSGNANYRSLGSRGEVKFNFQNKAVKIEEKWYIIAPLYDEKESDIRSEIKKPPNPAST